ncbi:MAG TPA: iron-containing alcohol dehydrogenase [Eubacteriales bacterium]|nr:iron-containing alcohol dehydrogenase [Eubacteriales bacterium]
MENFEFSLPTKVYFGRGYEEKSGAIIKSYGYSSALVVIGQGSVKKSGLLDKVTASLKEAGVEFFVLEGVQPNPLLGKVKDGIELVRNKDIKFILAVGGGSVIDTAKAIGIGALYDGPVWDFFGLDAKAKPKKSLAVGTILTIAAAGSETSNSCVITNEDGMLKRSTSGDALRPLFSVLNPENAATLSPHQVACGVSDMMAHIIERYFTNTKNVHLSDMMSEAVMRSVVFNGPEAVKNPSGYDAMAEIMWAASIAHNGILGMGREEDWASHKIAHELSTVFGTAHGEALAVVLPAWMGYTVNHDVRRFARFARQVFSIPYDYNDFLENALDGIASFRQFLKNLGLKTSLSELGATENDIAALAAATAKRPDTGTIGNFVALDKNDILNILKLAL